MPSQSYGRFEKVLRMGEGRRLKRLAEQAVRINEFEPELESLTDAQLLAHSSDLKQRVANGEALDDVLFEAFALVREARKRESGQRLFDVQMMGGIVLHEGDIAEMKTGEGKTFVASLPLYLNALSGENVHLVTVNDYLAKRDAEWNRGVYERLGMTVGAIENMMPFADRKLAYGCDITYGTNSEFGFDYLRDNMAVSLDNMVQRGHAYAIVDEVDSILVDEARTPLIISGEPETAAKTYYDFARVVRELHGQAATRKTMKGEDETELSGADYLYDEKFKTVSPAQTAIEKVERALGVDNLYDPRHVRLVNHLIQALKAESLYKNDVDYVIQDGEVKIVDEFTGRIMEGRRWSEGLHQAIEAKEGVRIREENVTLATITLQNYFRLYEKLGGMTGTAKTEEKEFVEIYNLHVVEIPTNVPVARARRERLHLQDEGREVERGRRRHRRAPREGTAGARRHDRGGDVRVPVRGAETARDPAQRAQREGARARGEIIQFAGEPGAVTIATNMAGRGVDIKLGEGVRELGGLYVLGTERHESRRIDNQLRGRSGRQGDPGETRFYLSAQDDLVRLFAGDRIHGIMNRFKIPDDQPMEAVDPLAPDRGRAEEGRGAELRRAQERPQVRRRDEHAAHGDLRAAPRRARRRRPVRRDRGVDRRGDRGQRRAAHRRRAAERVGSRRPRRADAGADGTDITVEELREEIDVESREALVEEFVEDALDIYAEREEGFTPELLREIERFVVLQVVDTRWREHLEAMDYLRDGIHLRAMAQKDPLVEYRGEGHAMFEDLSRAIREEAVLTLFHVELAQEEAADLQPAPAPQALSYEHETAAGADAILAAGGGAATAVATSPAESFAPQQVVNQHRDVGRNDPCWCGSGKKYKRCHGA